LSFPAQCIQQNGNGPNLLTCGTAGRPDPKFTFLGFSFLSDQRGYHLMFEQGERDRLAEELAVADTQGPVIRRGFRLASGQIFAIGLLVHASCHRLPPAHRLSQKSPLVRGNIQAVALFHALDQRINPTTIHGFLPH